MNKIKFLYFFIRHKQPWNILGYLVFSHLQFLSSVCLAVLHSLSTKKPSHQAFAFGRVVQRVEGRQTSVMNFLPEVIYTSVVEICIIIFFSLKPHLCASASASSCPHLLHAHLFCMLLKNAHTDTDCESTITFMEAKHLKHFFPSFHSLNSSSSSFCHTIPTSFLHFILKSTHSSMDLSSFRIM